jgi:hypothetical protein
LASVPTEGGYQADRGLLMLVDELELGIASTDNGDHERELASETPAGMKSSSLAERLLQL